MSNLQKNKMETTPIFKLIMSMSLPAMFSMLIQSLYNIVDSYFVAQIGEDALTAVSLAFPVQMLLISFGVGTGIGINSLVSRRLGEKNQKEADGAASHGVVLGILTWAIFALCGIFFTRIFFQAFTDDAAVLSMGISYTSIVTIFSFGIFVEINLEKTLQATGNMIYPMVFQLVGCITNIILDPIMIFGLFGMPKMGVIGAAVATVIGQVTAMIFAMYIAFKKSHSVHISLKGFRINKKILGDIYKVAAPSILMQSIGSVLIVGLNTILIQFSKAAVSVLGVYFKLQSFVFMPVFGLTHGVMPIMGYNYGAGNKKRLMDTLKYGCIIALSIMFAGTVIFWAIPTQLLMIFNASSQMLEIGVPALRTISLCFTAAALGIMFSTIFQAMGFGHNSLIVSIMRQLVVILPAAYLLSLTGLNNIWYAFPLAEIVSFGVSVLLFARLYHTKIKKLQPLINQKTGG